MADLPVIAPLHTWGPADLLVDSIHAVVPNPTAPTLFVLTKRDSLDLVLVFLNHWPWILAVISAVIAGVCIWRVRRVLIRRQRLGVRYCRACSYDLSGHGAENTPCPECGRIVRPRSVIIGRSTSRQIVGVLALPLTAAVAVGVVSAKVIIAGAAESPQLTPSWVDTILRRIAKPAPPSYTRPRTLLLELEVVSGRSRTRASLCELMDLEQLSIAPDALSAVLHSWDPNDFLRISTRSGRVLDRRSAMRDDVPIGVSQDSTSYFIATLMGDPRQRQTLVYEWRFADASTTPLFNLDTVEGTFGEPYPRRVVPVPGADAVFLQYPRARSGATLLSMHEPRLERESLIPIDLDTRVANLAIGPTMAMFIDMGKNCLLIYNIREKAVHAYVSLPGREYSAGRVQIAISPDESLFGYGNRQSIRMGDVASARWRAVLTAPENGWKGQRVSLESLFVENRTSAVAALYNVYLPGTGTMVDHKVISVWNIDTLARSP